MRVLIAEDDPVSVTLYTEVLEAAGYEVLAASTGPEALERLYAGEARIAVLDWEMPGSTGVEVCQTLRDRGGRYVYVVMVTARDGRSDVVDALRAGADDFVRKPVNPEELVLRVRAGERLMSLEGRDLVIYALARLAESRDNETGAHIERTRTYCRILAEQLLHNRTFGDEIDGAFVDLIYMTSAMHDIGKIGIPDAVLLKPGRLTEDEFDVMKRHTVIGAETLDSALDEFPDAGFLRMARDIALSHHERFDGTGYPNRLEGDQIPLSARVMAVADVYDALVSKRHYKEAFTHEHAVRIIVDGCGLHFDPRVVEAFLDRQDEFLRVRDALSTPDEHNLAA